MGLFEWGEKRFARGITKAMTNSYLALKANNLNLSERELIKMVLSTRSGIPANELFQSLGDDHFWNDVANRDFIEVVYLLIRMEYIEYMGDSLEDEDPITNSAFKEVLINEMQKTDLK